MPQTEKVKKDDTYMWTVGSDRLVICVNRVAKDGTWADITVVPPHGRTWNKRQPLPFPGDFIRREG